MNGPGKRQFLVTLLSTVFKREVRTRACYPAPNALIEGGWRMECQNLCKAQDFLRTVSISTKKSFYPVSACMIMLFYQSS